METVTVNRRELLRFMNSGVAEANGHHTALTSLLGEPLAVGLVLHYFRAQGKQAEFISWKVTQGTRKGSRLDAWLLLDGTLYQTEIKMWAGNAIGGIFIQEDAPEDWQIEKGTIQWEKWIWNTQEAIFFDDNVRKVLTKMRVPKKYEHLTVRPLLILWWLVQPQTEAKAWSTLRLGNHQNQVFDEVDIFSLTRYLLGLQDKQLQLEMPRLAERLHWLKRLFPEA